MRFHPISFVSAALVTAALGCSGGPTSADGANAVDQAQLRELWTEGQHYLAQLGEHWEEEGRAPITGDVFAVGTSRFHFIVHDEPLTLRGEPVGGYFDPGSQTVHFYRPMMEGAIPHEVGHAVLFVLRDPRWKCAFHNNCD
jgi:hypothetical protein